VFGIDTIGNSKSFDVEANLIGQWVPERKIQLPTSLAKEPQLTPVTYEAGMVLTRCFGAV
jgi:hypothetical protein